MSGFIGEMINEFTHQGQQGGGSSGPPQCPPPWRAEWDQRDNRWIYVNQQTGQRQFEFPSQGGGGYGGGGYGGGYNQGPPPQQQKHSSGPGWGGAALGMAAGVAGGMFLNHEGHEIKQDFEEDKYRTEERFDQAGNYAERKFDDGVQNVEDFPEDAARWTGRQEQRIEDIPEDVGQAWDRTEDRVEGGFDRFAQGVADVPEDIAGFAGRIGGNVDRFGDNMDNAYDEGRNEGRQEDGW